MNPSFKVWVEWRASNAIGKTIWIDITLKKVTDQENYRIFDAFKQHNYSMVIDLIDAHSGVIPWMNMVRLL